MMKRLVAVGLAILLEGTVHAQVHGDLKAKTVVTDAATAAPGNLMSVPENTVASFTPSCANSGIAGSLTLIDTSNVSGTRVWTLCDGTSSFYVFPDFGSDTPTNGETIVCDPQSGGRPVCHWATNASLAGTIEDTDLSPAVVGAGTLKFPNGTVVSEVTNSIARIEPFAGQFPAISGQWYDSSMFGNVGDSITTGDAATANTMYYVPFYNPFQMTIKDMGMASGTANLLGGNIKMCIYAVDPTTGKPSTVVVDKANKPFAMTNAATTLWTVATAPPGQTFGNVTLQPGMYYLAFISDAAVGLVKFGSGTNTDTKTSLFGYSTLLRGTTRDMMYADTSGFTYGSIGTACPTASTVAFVASAWRLGVQAN